MMKMPEAIVILIVRGSVVPLALINGIMIILMMFMMVFLQWLRHAVSMQN